MSSEICTLPLFPKGKKNSLLLPIFPYHKTQALSIQEGVDLQHFQSEMSAVLVTMLCWRWLNVSIGKAFF